MKKRILGIIVLYSTKNYIQFSVLTIFGRSTLSAATGDNALHAAARARRRGPHPAARSGGGGGGARLPISIKP